MKIDVTSIDASLSEVLRGTVVRRVLLALSRFGPRVRKVTVRLAAPVNALGGVDQRCRMRAWLPDRDDIHAEALNGGIEGAVGRASAQLAKRVASALGGGASGGTSGGGDATVLRRRLALRPVRRTRSR